MAIDTLTLEGAQHAKRPLVTSRAPTAALIAQPDQARLPIRVPVVAQCGGQTIKAEVIGSTDNVLLLQGSDPDATLPPLGSPMRVRIVWDRQLLIGRLAAHGVAGRFLVSIGERAIRYSRRFPVDLPGIANSAHLYGPVEVRVVDLSTGGARVRGIDLPVGTEIQLQFTPPGQTAQLTVLGFVVRAIDGAEMPTLGVAFRLVQPSMDLLAAARSA
jgi:hypothetical protein